MGFSGVWGDNIFEDDFPLPDAPHRAADAWRLIPKQTLQGEKNFAGLTGGEKASTE